MLSDKDKATLRFMILNEIQHSVSLDEGDFYPGSIESAKNWREYLRQLMGKLN